MADPQPVAARPAEPPDGRALYQMAIGHYVSRALYLAAKLELADRLSAGADTVEALAAASETHPPSLTRLLRLLVSVGLFEEADDGTFSLTPLGGLLRADVPESMRAMVMLFAGVGLQDDWRELEYCVRTGFPAFHKADPDSNPFAHMDPEQRAVFDAAMATFAPRTAAAVAAAYDFSTFRTVADIGGGNGALLMGLLRANPRLRGIVFDLPDVAEEARQQVAAAGMADRCDVIAGSFFDAIPPGADAYLLKHVIHDWNDAQAADILQRCRAVTPPGGKLLIVEDVYPSRIDTSLASRGAATNDMNMLVATGGRQRSEAEFRALFAAAGWTLARVVRTQAPVCVIEAE